ncbi:hypothetical protein F5984_14665 [Rudanella paleaurantiibacter]|uniref:Ig-like domain-containing protein n=1 Tax=Rudanella paleaurantiibacter TaxID=2614655 RepID=A0A7J5TZA6_9BACT|nr:hypothetical protein [Rudanella paleaurantiibacter]KAB7730391.1 hypothetical protein F5984_14665 [Rudanella paleaurantiibacter]
MTTIRYRFLLITGLLCIWAGLRGIRAQTIPAPTNVLGVGDVMITAYNSSDDKCNGSSVNDQFVFIPLKDLAAGTVIYFTDYGWVSGGGFQSRRVASPANNGTGSGGTNDGIISWTTSVSVAAGTQIAIRCKYSPSASLGTAAGVETAALLATNSQPPCTDTYYMDLSDGSPDQIFAYQAASPRAPNPTVLTGVLIRGEGGWNSTLFDSSPPNSSSSTLPSTLVMGNSAFELSVPDPPDNVYFFNFLYNLAKYDCANPGNITLGFPKQLRQSVYARATGNNPTALRWTYPTGGGCDGFIYQPNPNLDCPQSAIPTGFTMPNACVFTVLQVKITAQPQSRTICSYQQTQFAITSQNAQTYKWQVSPNGTSWTDLTDGTVYSGVTSQTLTVLSASGLHNTRYRCIAMEPTEPSSVTSLTALLTVNDPPQALALTPSGPITCTALSVSLTASTTTPSTTFAYTGPTGPIGVANNIRVFTTSAPGLYSVTATAPNTCTSTASTTVLLDQTPPADPLLAVDGVVSCTGSATLTASTSTTGSFGYQFRNAGGVVAGSGNIRIVNTPGIYSVVITSNTNGCTSVAANTVLPDLVPPQTVTLLASSTVLTCAIPSVTMTAGSTTADVVYSFRGPSGVLGTQSTVNTRVISSPGTYSVTVTGPNGCTTLQTTSVTQNTLTPAISATSVTPALVCAEQPFTVGVTATGGVDGLSYNWVETTGSGAAQWTANVPSPAHNTASVTIPGTLNTLTANGRKVYSYTVTDNASGCSVTGSVSVSVTAIAFAAAPTLVSTSTGPGLPFVVTYAPAACSFVNPTAFTVEVSDGNGVFGVNSTTVTPSSSTASSLTFTIPAALVSSAGYRLKVIYNGSVYSPASSSFTVSSLSITASQTTACVGQTIQLTASGCPSPNVVVWSTGEQAPFIIVSLTATTTISASCVMPSGAARVATPAASGLAKPGAVGKPLGLASPAENRRLLGAPGGR